MPNSKIKNMVLLILSLCCLCLLALVIPTRLQERQQLARTDAQLRALYAAEGLTLPEAALPKSLPLELLDAQLDAEAARAVAQALLGSELMTEEDTGGFQLSYSAPSGSCTIRRGALEAELSGGDAVSGSLRRSAMKTMRRMGLSAAEASEPAVTDGGSEVTVHQSLLDVPVFSAELRFLYSGGVLRRVSGVCCPIAETLTAASGSVCISCTDALTVFLGAREQTGWVGSAVTGIQQGYLLADTASASTFRLVPVWRLETDTGIFFVNGITREVTSAHS